MITAVHDEGCMRTRLLRLHQDQACHWQFIGGPWDCTGLLSGVAQWLRSAAGEATALHLFLFSWAEHHPIVADVCCVEVGAWPWSNCRMDSSQREPMSKSVQRCQEGAGSNCSGASSHGCLLVGIAWQERMPGAAA